MPGHAKKLVVLLSAKAVTPEAGLHTLPGGFSTSCTGQGKGGRKSLKNRGALA